MYTHIKGINHVYFMECIFVTLIVCVNILYLGNVLNSTPLFPS